MGWGPGRFRRECLRQRPASMARVDGSVAGRHASAAVHWIGLTSDTEPHRPAPALYVHAADGVGRGCVSNGGRVPFVPVGWGRSGNGTDLNTSAYQRTPGGGAAPIPPRLSTSPARRPGRGGIVARPAQPERAAPAPNVDNPRCPLAAAVARSGRRHVGQRGHVSHRAGSVGTAVAAPDPPRTPSPPWGGLGTF